MPGNQICLLYTWTPNVWILHLVSCCWQFRYSNLICGIPRYPWAKYGSRVIICYWIMFQSLATSKNVETEMESRVEVFEHILNKASNIRGERSSKKSTPVWNTFELKSSQYSLTREILFLPREHKIHIFEPTCNVLFIIRRLNIEYFRFYCVSK